jgi:glycolate oxidase iron-sulfur subunit
MKIHGEVERLLADAGYTLVPVIDTHLCCGSAGTFSILQPELANALKSNKLHALEAHRPDIIATANIGCMTHLASGTRLPIRHWIELIDTLIADSTDARVRPDASVLHL